ncbi:protein-L-isoaspartate(D-aspartate) O-methyltransferase [Actinacidiphila sp. ITFR-21]|uniref:protein-L-isoaspartate(D-aspartate) O-methyltransferase n=1 Tax=Actinacidiphila sp. ITFR-21 TaxID=3075199 RepID=UPI00288C3CE2|nr:protein-L-isoaspartate(D-aspartate) O-methyltransferase [Streptomyces sp. ITFR-21]WNI19971.1 protein-L-isoaspartate(D-aspartate) O-methyltransferase [Streptomyces sp. ITFR-21]
MNSDAALHKLVGTLTADRDLAPHWRQALLDTPRHPFLRPGFFRPQQGTSYWEPVVPGNDDWLPGCYTDTVLVTELAGAVSPQDVDGRITANPTRSALPPGHVLRMLDAARTEPGMRVLEVGTGTGYTTALLCHRLGDKHVTSTDTDYEVSSRAGITLEQLGHSPELLAGDDVQDKLPRHRYDRLIATSAVRDLPVAWLTAVKHGGQIIAALGGWMGATTLVHFTVDANGTAVGRPVTGDWPADLATDDRIPQYGPIPDGGRERQVAVDPQTLEDGTARFIAQTAELSAQIIRLTGDDSSAVHDSLALLDQEDNSWAVLRRRGGKWMVRQGGETLLWDRIETELIRWHRDGRPPLKDLLIVSTPHWSRPSVTWTPAL